MNLNTFKANGHVKSSFSHFIGKNNTSNTSASKSYGALFGQGPIKIKQKMTLNGSSNKKNQDSTAKKSKNSQNTNSSQKIKISKSYISQMTAAEQNEIRTNLNTTYQQKLAEQRAQNAKKAQTLRD